jgi:hypothetical protein
VGARAISKMLSEDLIERVGLSATRGLVHIRSAPIAGKCEVDVTLEESLNKRKHGFRSNVLLTEE